jgi:hypothetical protein
MANKLFGFASAEYLLILMLVILAVAVGKPSALEQFISALQTTYQRFSFALSLT